MHRLKKVLAAVLLVVVATFFAGCNKISGDVKVTTYEPQEITENQAKCGGDVIVAQGLSLTEIGVCWSTERNPTYSDDHVSTTVWNEPFVCTVEGLEPDTKYHVRAYALRGLELYYGNDKSFVTKESSGGGSGGGEEPPVQEDDYVDLGLPSGLLWATCNVGASRPEAFGSYFAWGEVDTKDNYALDTYKFYSGSSMIKYTSTDMLTVLLPEDDAAEVLLGNGWKIPSKGNWEELMANCDLAYTKRNGVNGELFTSKINGKSIFLPAAGYYNYSSPQDQGINGRYWASSLYLENDFNAWRLMFNSGGPSVSSYNRSCGQSIRPVRLAN